MHVHVHVSVDILKTEGLSFFLKKPSLFQFLAIHSFLSQHS